MVIARSSVWSALARIFCSAHVGTGSETIVQQKSQQVRASGTDSPKRYVEYDTLYDYLVREEVSEVPGRMVIDPDGINDIIFSEQLSRAIRKKCEFSLVGSETDSNNVLESKLISVTEDAQLHSHLLVLKTVCVCRLQTKDN